jgi:hypothetical protein
MSRTIRAAVAALVAATCLTGCTAPDGYSPAAPTPRAAATGHDAPGPVAAAGTLTTGAGRLVEFLGFDRSGPGPNGTANLGDVLCRKTQDACGFVTVQLTVRWDELHGGAATAAAGRRMRMVTISRAALRVPAQGRRRVEVTLGPRSARCCAPAACCTPSSPCARPATACRSCTASRCAA